MFLLLSFVPNNLVRLTAAASADESPSHCVPVSGALMTNIGAIAGVTKLGPAHGDLSGSVAATILGREQQTISPSSRKLGMGQISASCKTCHSGFHKIRRFVEGELCSVSRS